MDNMLHVVLMFSVFFLGLFVTAKSIDRFKRDTDASGLTMKSYQITSLVKERFSIVNIHSRLQNVNPCDIDSMVFVQVPDDAIISSFSVVVNGTEYRGNVVSNEEKEEIYNATESKLDVQVKFLESDKERGVHIFQVNISVEAGAETTFVLTYNQFLERRLGLYTQRIIVHPGQVVDTLMVNATVLENQGFEKFFYTVPNSNETFSSCTLSKPMANDALFRATKQQQLESSSKGIDGELVINYDLKHEQDAGNVVVEGDYFVHSFTPNGLKTMDKNILFVIDASGSMSGTKIRQVRESMFAILDNLNPNDDFNIITFSTYFQVWSSSTTKASYDRIYRAKSFVNRRLQAGGGTDINDALLKAIRLLKSDSTINDTRAQVIFFLTDGQPSEGVTDTKQIRQNVIEVNNGFAAIYCLGFGFSLDVNFLKNLAYENNGFSRQIYEDADATEQLVDIYTEIKDPLLLDVVLNYDTQYVDLNSTTTNKFYQYFKGSEIVVAGKLKKSGILPAGTVNVRGVSKDGNLTLTTKSVTIRPIDKNSGNKKLRDYKKIQELMRIYSTQNSTEKAKQLAIELAIENNFLTQFTSFILQVHSPLPTQLPRNKAIDTRGFGAFTVFICVLNLYIGLVSFK